MPEVTGPIIVAGEALIDVIHGEDGTVLERPGGGPFNAARTIARLDGDVAFLGRISTDAGGMRLRQILAEDAVQLELVVPTDDPTTCAHAWLTGGVASYEFETVGTSAAGLRETDVRMPTQPCALLVGTLGLVLEPMAATLEALVARMKAQTLVVVDPNCRPAAIHDEPGYRARLGRIIPRADVVKVSEEDLAWLYPRSDPADGARDLVARGAGAALVTLGADGALLVTRERVTTVPAPPVRVVDTIGAGDAFAGAFVTRWAELGLTRASLTDPDALESAARFACVVAARTCERAGADPPRRCELATRPPSIARPV